MLGPAPEKAPIEQELGGGAVELGGGAVDFQCTEVANAVRAACKRLWGRGPRNVQVLFAGEDTVVVMLSGILTSAERTLLAAAREVTVISQRAGLHEALEPEIRVLVEASFGRETDAFISGIDVDRDVASLVVTMVR